MSHPESSAAPVRPATTADDREQRTLVAASEQRARDRRLTTRDLVLSIATPILLLVLWELCARVEIIDPRFFPPPTRILAAGWEMLLSGELWQHTAPTLMRLAVGGGFFKKTLDTLPDLLHNLVSLLLTQKGTKR
jgi:NitT/TauT family transport system permease protein